MFLTYNKIQKGPAPSLGANCHYSKEVCVDNPIHLFVDLEWLLASLRKPTKNVNEASRFGCADHSIVHCQAQERGVEQKLL